MSLAIKELYQANICPICGKRKGGNGRPDHSQCSRILQQQHANANKGAKR